MNLKLTPPPSILEAKDDPESNLRSYFASNLAEAKIVLLGYPSDSGTMLGSGRRGCAFGPNTIRSQFYKLRPDPTMDKEFINVLRHVFDLGDLETTDTVQDNQESLGEAVATIFTCNAVPIILGGSHDLTYGHFLGYQKSEQVVSVLNCSAHSGVRQLIENVPNSHSPFTQILDRSHNNSCSYTVLGLQQHSVTSEEVRYLNQNTARFIWHSELTKERIEEEFSKIEERGSVMASMDLHALPSYIAPGSSQPSPIGIDLELWFFIAELLGRSKSVKSFDLAELNPNYDRDHQTAKVAALTIWHFIRGFSRRP